MDLTLVILGTICFALLFGYLTNLFQWFIYFRQINKLPGPFSIPFLIPVYELIHLSAEGRFQWIINYQKKHKDGFVTVWLAQDALVRVRKPEHLEQVLPSTVNINKSTFYTFLEPWLGRGLLTSSGQKWFHDRKLLTPAFHFSILEQFADVMTEKTAIMIKCLEKEIKQKPGQAIDVFAFAVRCTLDIICETAMGINVHAQDDEEIQYVKFLHIFSRKLLDRIVSPLNRWDFFYYRTKGGKEVKEMIGLMHKFTDEVIRKRILARKEEKSKNTPTGQSTDPRKRKAFLDLLLDENEKAQNPLSDVELREQVDTFMFTGHDTTAAGISWALFCLGNNLDCQEKLHKELDEVFGNSKEPATLDQLSQLEYLKRVTKEALRLYPSAPEISRQSVTDIQIDEYTIPKETNVTISPYNTHRDPDHWPNAEKFDPDRFLPENCKGRHPYAYIPFSAGPRNCIGQKFAQLEEKIVLTEVLRKWKVKAVEKPENIKLYSALILRPSEGIFLHFTPRGK